MLLIREKSTNPHFNLALEEHLFNRFEEDIFRFWRNEPSVVIGKHQIALAEIDFWYCSDHKIPVVRRLSGGGTVFHDPGNINFTLIRSGEQGKLVDFQKYMKPIADILAEMGVQTNFSGRNDILLKGFKVSGNAEHTRKNKVIHHGTLLYDSELSALGKAITRKKGIVQGRAVQSVRSKVTNIKKFHDLGTTEDFLELLNTKATGYFPNSTVYEIEDADRYAVKQLIEQKYGTWDWNYGYSPAYTFTNENETGFGKLSINLQVTRGGQIKDAHFECPAGFDFNSLSSAIKGLLHRKKDLEIVVEAFQARANLPMELRNEIIRLMF